MIKNADGNKRKIKKKPGKPPSNAKEGVRIYNES
jgi:hypothetical protein